MRVWDSAIHREDSETLKKIVRIVPLLLLILSLILLSTNYYFIAAIFSFLFYVFEALQTIKMFISKSLILPRKSIRNLIIMFTSLIIVLLPMFFLSCLLWNTDFGTEGLTGTTDFFTEVLEEGLIAKEAETGLKILPVGGFILTYVAYSSIIPDLLSFLVVSLSVLITYPFALINKLLLISKAKNKLKHFPSLKVIAITGSFGKSTTKEILYRLLKEEFKTAKTPRNYNTDVGIAKSILTELKQGTEIFVAEMGAYRVGEIKAAAKVLRPNISIVTGVNEQHVSLFGSIKNTIKAKYEIIEALTDEGVAILNGDNEYTLRMAEKSTRREVMYFTNRRGDETAAGVAIKEKNYIFPDASRSTLVATDITKVKGRINFKLLQNNNQYNLTVALDDTHNVSNLLAAMAACLEVGMKLEELVKAIPRVEFDLPHLNIRDGINDSRIIDDSYNSNSDGFIKALEKLKNMKGEKKIVVTQGILQLGQMKREVYKKIIPALVNSADRAIVSDPVLYEEVKDFNNTFEISISKDQEAMLAEILRSARRDTVFLFEGNIPPKIKGQTFK